MNNFHSSTCGLRHGGKECTCEFFKPPTTKEKEHAALLAERDALKALLKKVEWVKFEAFDSRRCLLCGFGEHELKGKHDSGCALAAALKEKP